MSQGKTIEELYKEIMTSFDGMGSLPNFGRPTSHPGSSSGSSTATPAPGGEEWISIPFDGWGSLGEPVAEQKQGASTHRVIPEKCEYARALVIPGAPVVPLSPRTAEDHPDMLVDAQRKIRRWVASNYRTWPCCGPSNRNVDIEFNYDFDSDKGGVLVGYFFCESCARR